MKGSAHMDYGRFLYPIFEKVLVDLYEKFENMEAELGIKKITIIQTWTRDIRKIRT